MSSPMEKITRPKRSYNSTRRRQQAEETRRVILDAAFNLFARRGYAETTIDAIAQAADVAPETVYAAFGNKPALLRNLLNIRLVGDLDPRPIFERPSIQSALAEMDASGLIGHFSIDMYQIMSRVSPVFAILRATAKTDEEINALLNNVVQLRLEGMKVFLHGLQRFEPLRAGLSLDRAAEIVFALSGAEMFDQLTGEFGWSEEQYISWLSESITRQILA